MKQDCFLAVWGRFGFINPNLGLKFGSDPGGFINQNPNPGGSGFGYESPWSQIRDPVGFGNEFVTLRWFPIGDVGEVCSE